MARKSVCFVSFCESDGNPDEIMVLINELRILTDHTIRFAVSLDLTVGDNIKTHEGLIEEEADTFLLLGTPEYKRRVETRELGTGVFREFSAYLHRKDISTTNPAVKKSIAVLPVVWRGTFADSLPSFFEGMEIAASLSGFLTYKTDDGRRLSQDSRKRVKDELFRLANRLKAFNSAYSSEEILRGAYQDFDISYFRNQKFEREPLDHLKNYLFVKTRQFLRIRDQEEFLLVGRKGVGKTTLIEIMESENLYKLPIEIIVDRWNVHGVGITSYQKIASGDFKYLHRDKNEAFQLLWAAFIFIQLLRNERLIRKSDVTLINVHPTASRLISESPTHDKAAEFTSASDLVSEYIQEMVDKAPVESRAMFDAYLQRKLDIDHLIDWIAGGADNRALCMDMIARERHLISLDGFDSTFQKSRNDGRNTGYENHQYIIKTEIDWLTAFIEVIEAIKRPSERGGWRMLGSLCSVSVVAAIPKDRFLEVQGRRDSVLAASTRELRWTGIELVSLLRKRVEASGQFNTRGIKQAGASPLERMNVALERVLPELSVSVTAHVNSKSFEFDLFREVLRHTFWRPRDVLIHYAELLAVVRENRKIKRKTSPSVLSIVLSRTNNIIIEHEWLGEMREFITNIDDVIKTFGSGNQLIEYQYVFDTLELTPFTFMYQRNELETHEKMSLLYELGFFGLRRKEFEARVNRRMRDLFYHIYPEKIDFHDNNLHKTYSLVIHPIFIERLNLTQNVDSPVMNFSWTEIDEHDASGG